MNDIYSFFRYLLPGITFLLEAYIFLLISDPHIPESLLQKLNLANQGVPVVVLALTFLSMGVGSTLTLIYRAFPGVADLLKINYAPFLKQLLRQRLISKTSFPPDRRTRKPKQLKRYAWIIMTTLWFERAIDTSATKAAEERSKGLANMMHSSAAALVGSVLLIPTYLVTTLLLGNGLTIFPVRIWAGLAVALFFLWLHRVSFLEAKKSLKQYVEIILLKQLLKEKEIRVNTSTHTETK